MNCKKCGNQLGENEKFCSKCGEPATVEEQPKKSNGLIIAIIVIVVLFVIIAILAIAIVGFFLVKKTGTDTPTTTTTTSEVTTVPFDDDKKEVIKNLDFTNVSFKAEDNNERSKNVELVKANMNKPNGTTPSASIGIMNKNSENIDINIYVNYYKDGQRVGSDYASNMFVKPNVIAVLNLSLSNKEDYDSFDITYTTKPGASYMVDVPVNSSNFKEVSDDKEGIYGKFTNNVKEEVYAYASCIRYKGNDIVSVEFGSIGSVKPGKTADCKCYKSNTLEGIEYDKTLCIPYNVYYTKGE